MSVSDLYNPNIQQSSWVDKMSDNLLGTNKVDTNNQANKYEYQKAVNINKYQWNKEGMVQAGINPLMNSESLGAVAGSQAGSSQSPSAGVFGDGLTGFVSDVLGFALDRMNPKELEKKAEKIVQTLL